jgi:hypothetical protein
MAKVSFDFDSTLSLDVVQKLAKNIIDEGHEVWIVTSRFEYSDSSGNKVNNDDLFETAIELNIFKEQIHFCNMSDKYEFLKDKNFLWHLDDDDIELQFIRNYTNVLPIHRRGGNDWYNQCLDTIRIFG